MRFAFASLHLSLRKMNYEIRSNPLYLCTKANVTIESNAASLRSRIGRAVASTCCAYAVRKVESNYKNVYEKCIINYVFTIHFFPHSFASSLSSLPLPSSPSPFPSLFPSLPISHPLSLSLVLSFTRIRLFCSIPLFVCRGQKRLNDEPDCYYVVIGTRKTKAQQRRDNSSKHIERNKTSLAWEQPDDRSTKPN